MRIKPDQNLHKAEQRTYELWELLDSDHLQAANHIIIQKKLLMSDIDNKDKTLCNSLGHHQEQQGQQSRQPGNHLKGLESLDSKHLQYANLIIIQTVSNC